jgi:hypothetical protein
MAAKLIAPKSLIMRAAVPFLLLLLGPFSAPAAEFTDEPVLIAKPSSDEPVVLIAKPKFVRLGDFIDLVVSDTNHTFQIGWAKLPDFQFFPVPLDSNCVYTFTVDTNWVPARAFPLFRSPIYPRLHRLQKNGRTLYDIELCEVHHTRMEYKEVPVAYGRYVPGPGDPSRDTEQELFPHRREISFGGCCVTFNSPTTYKIFVCNQCKKAFKWWSGTAEVPPSVLPRVTRFDRDPALRAAFLDSFRKGYVAAWAPNESQPVFAWASQEDQARTFGYMHGADAGRAARDAWSGANGRPYGSPDASSPSR